MARPVVARAREFFRRVRDAWSRPAPARLSLVAAIAGLILVLALTWLVGQAWIVAQIQRAGEPTTGPNDAAQSAAQARQPQEARPAAGATLALAEDTVRQEGEITVSGSGFGPFESVVLRAANPNGGEVHDLARAGADWRGSFSGQKAQLPDWLTSGAQQLEAVGERSGIRTTTTLYVRAKDRWVNLGSYGVRQAERTGFIAGGFEPGEQVNVYLAQGENLQPDASATPVLTVPTDRAGNTAWSELEVPLVKPGTYSLMFRGATSGGEALSRNIVINALTPHVELSPWSGPPGSDVNVNGEGFVPGEDVGVYVGDSDQAVLTVKADQYGNFWGAGPVPVPYEARGPARITFIGQASHALVTSSFSVVAPKPWVELSTYAGFAGTSVFFSGGGFAARERVTVHLDSDAAPIVSVGEVNDQGFYQFIGPVNVPPAATGEVTFVVVGERSHAEGSATFKILTPWVPGAPDAAD